jgi:hypothetical protein
MLSKTACPCLVEERSDTMKEQRILLLGFSFVVVISVLFGGCASNFNNISPPDSFLQNKNASVGLIWVCQMNIQYPEGPEYTAKHYMLGHQGLLDTVVSLKLSEKLANALNKIKLEELMKERFFPVFQAAFENYNFNVKIKAEPYCWKKFRLGSNKYCENALDIKKMEIKKAGEMPIPVFTFDYKPVFEELGVDYLLVIDLIQHGTGRSYFAMTPTSPPKGTTMLTSHLIEHKEQAVLSQHLCSIVEPVQGEWDEPPEYANLLKAARDSFEIAVDEVFIDIFKEAP